MSSLSLETQSRVQCIKQKFETSVSETNRIARSSKSSNSGTSIGHGDTNPGSVFFSKRTTTVEFSKTDANGGTGAAKAHVKRTPAFRREKMAAVKALLGKAQNEVALAGGRPFLGPDKQLPLKLRQDQLTDNQKLPNLQRSKTDELLVKLCDSKNSSNANCTKSTLISRRMNLLGENENTLAYAVVDKTQKKKSQGGRFAKEAKEEKETELKLSESLRKALQSPLPKGPPPKKPPRTFCHVVTGANLHPDTNTSKDLPKLKSKLEKLENIVKSRDKRSTTLSRPSTPGDMTKALLEDKVSKSETLCESKSLPSALKKKNENRNCLQLTSCMNPCTDVVLDERLFEERQLSSPPPPPPLPPSSTSVHKTESTPCTKAAKNDINVIKSLNGAAVRRTMSEPIYDLPCVTAKGIITENKSSQRPSEFKTPEEGLHYMCTDVVNKLNRVKPVEFSPADSWKQNFMSSRLTAKGGCDGGLKEMSRTARARNGTEEDSETSGKGSPTSGTAVDDGRGAQPDGKSVKSDSDSWSMGSESEKEWTQGSDLCSQDGNGTVKSSSVKKEILSRKTAQRKDYVNKVSSKLFNCVPYWMSLKGNNCAHLFECCLLVGLTLESEKNVPYIKNIYPPDVKPPPLIEALCFPDASNWPPNTGNEPEEQYYSLVVTNENGERKFGYCRRVLPEGGNICLPLTYCIITPHRANGFFYKVLEELESRHGSAGMENFIRQLYEAQFPGPGEVLKLKKILEEATKTSFTPKENFTGSTLVRRPCDVRLEEKNLTQLFQYLQLPVFVKIFSSLLHERKVLLLSNSLRKLSSCIEALQSTLLPFSWQHTYIPVLPVHLLETCEAPTPYVIGLPKSRNVQQSLENIVFENGIMVDLDECKILKCCGDEGTILPHRLIKSLKTSLNLAVNAVMLPETNRNVLISDAFIGFFVQVCGHYSKFISVLDGEKAFEQKEFVKHVTSATTQSFLEWFTKTAMFQAFIHERLHGIVEDVPVKLFTLRAMENPIETAKNSTVLPLNYRGLNKKVKSFSDKIKDFIQ